MGNYEYGMNGRVSCFCVAWESPEATAEGRRWCTYAIARQSCNQTAWGSPKAVDRIMSDTVESFGVQVLAILRASRLGNDIFVDLKTDFVG